MPARIAVTGLGRMGAAIAQRLLDTGAQLTVWNRTPAKALPFEERGALVAAGIAAAVAGADIVFSSLMDDASADELFGPSGPGLAALAPGAVHVSLTTISPGCADRLEIAHAARGAAFVAGPVVGRPDAAATGALLQFLAGDADAIARVEPVCARFAQRIVRLAGSAGVANRQKLCTNFFVIANLEVIGEALAFAERCGASPDALARLMEESYAAPALKGYVRRIHAHETSSANGFSLRAGRKDLQLIRDEAQRCDCPIELAGIIAGKMDAASARGLDDRDWSVIAQIGQPEGALR